MILVLALIVFAVSAYQLFGIIKGYMDGRNEYEEIRDLPLKAVAAMTNRRGSELILTSFWAVNPDTIGWTRFSPEPAIINYPIVQGEDNEEYLHKTFSWRMRILWERFS